MKMAVAIVVNVKHDAGEGGLATRGSFLVAGEHFGICCRNRCVSPRGRRGGARGR